MDKFSVIQAQNAFFNRKKISKIRVLVSRTELKMINVLHIWKNTESLGFIFVCPDSTAVPESECQLQMFVIIWI